MKSPCLRILRVAALMPLALGFAACAASQLTPLSDTHPASVSAPEAPMSPRRYNLQADDASLRTRDLLNPPPVSSPTGGEEKVSGEKSDASAPMNHGAMP